MLTEEHTKDFSYTYSARQQEELLAIRQKYLSLTEDKMEQLRKLDRQANLPGTIVAILLGIIGTFLLVIGICCIIIVSWRSYFAAGIFMGCVGLFLMSAAIPVNNIITKYMQKKVAAKVLAITDELLHK